MAEDEIIQLNPLEINMRYPPYIILLTIIFVLQILTKQKEDKIKKETYTDDHKSIARNFSIRYIIILHLAKAADWAINPYIFEFFRSRRYIQSHQIGNLLIISFFSNLFLGPSLIAYIIDKSNKKIPCLIYCIVMMISCSIRFIQHPFALIFSQITYGASTSILHSAFENWQISEIRQKFADERIRELVFSYIFEKCVIFDGMNAIITNIISGILYVLIIVIKDRYGLAMPFIFAIGCSILCLILSIILIPNIKPTAVIDENEL